MNPMLCAAVDCRRVGLNCVDELLALEEACFECDRISRRNLRNLLRSPSAGCLGVYSQDELVGSMVLLFRKNTRSARVYSVAVSASHRGRGIARRLMDQAECEARARACLRIRLEVRTDNVPAIKLYERLGFKAVRMKSGYYEDGSDAMTYCKELE
jgi:ribosomal protein S18 acetylase RimI-like enzyme